MKTNELPYSLIIEITQSFYQRATQDPMIGFHFLIIKDFEEHIPRIANFWFMQLNGQFYEPVSSPFDLLTAHRPLQLKIGQINRWVVLFKENLKTFRCSEHNQIFDQWLLKVDKFAAVMKEHLIA